jgi:hypothetical protein
MVTGSSLEESKKAVKIAAERRKTFGIVYIY